MVISEVLGSWQKNKANLGKRTAAACSLMNHPECAEQTLRIIREHSASVSLPLRTGFQEVHFALLFGYIRFNNWYVEVVSEIEYLVFIHSTFYCVMHWANFGLFTIHVTEPSTISALSSKNVCLGSSLIRVMGNWICIYGPEVTRAFTVLFSGTFLVNL